MATTDKKNIKKTTPSARLVTKNKSFWRIHLGLTLAATFKIRVVTCKGGGFDATSIHYEY